MCNYNDFNCFQACNLQFNYSKTWSSSICIFDRIYSYKEPFNIIFLKKSKRFNIDRKFQCHCIKQVSLLFVKLYFFGQTSVYRLL